MSDARRYCWEVTVDGFGGKPSTNVRVKERAAVGRDDDNDISFRDTMMSRRHAEFQERGSSLYLTDLSSTNGTYVNDVRIQKETAIHDGDIVCVGQTSLICHRIEVSQATEDEMAHGVVRSVVKRELTMRVMQTVVDVSDLAQEDRGLGVLCRATSALVPHQPLPELFEKVLDAILDSIPAQRATIMLLEGDRSTPIPKATRTRDGADLGEIQQEIVQRVLEGREAVLVQRPVFVNNLDDEPDAESEATHSVMCAPLWSASDGPKGTGRVLGLIYLDSPKDRPPLTDRDLHVLIMLANITATKVENAGLVEETQERRRIEEDMRLAASIQADLLPRTSPVLPGYRVCGMTEPCRFVGGDYFDFEYDGQTFYLALADVSGKGSGAAMLMVALRATVRAHWRDGSLTEATARINRTFHQTVPPDKYATLFLARLDPASGRLDYVNAGHNLPLLVRPDGQWHQLKTGGTMVGAFPDATYQQESVVLEPRDCLLVFSDGISDAWDNHEVADQHLVRLALERRSGDVTTLRSEIFKAAEKSSDDRTLIVVERLPESTGSRTTRLATVARR